MSLNMVDQYEKIYKYCYFKTGSCDLAEDLTQETFLRFLSQNSYLERGKPLAYLYTIARNLCIDTYRKQPAEELPKEVVMPGDLARQVADSVVIKQALELLNQEQRELILLRYVNELSMAEIGNITGQSRFSIRRSLNMAVKALQKNLKKEDFYE